MCSAVQFFFNSLCSFLSFILESESEVAQSCLTLWDPMGCRPPGSSVHGIFQARLLEWFAMSFSRGSPDPGIEPGSPTLQADSVPSEPPGKLFLHLSLVVV